MGYLLLIPCGMKTDIEGENKIVRNTKKIDILSPNIAINGDDQCSTWESFDFELLEWLILSFLAIALMYWGLRKVFRKEGLLDTMRKRKEETKTKKLQQMKDALAKQGMIVTENAIDMEEKVPEVMLKPFKG